MQEIGKFGEGLVRVLRIREPRAMISGTPFLSFAKAYINVMVLYRGLRGSPRTMVKAVILVEWALRSSNSGRNDPSLFGRETFVRAENALMSGSEHESKRYDIACELQMLAGMLQGGYHSKSFRFGTHGFGLLASRFTYSSSVPQPLSRKQRQLDLAVQTENCERRLPNEIVAAIGLAYRSALEKFGESHEVTAMAALAALPFTTTSMRLSDLLVLRSDALHSSEGRVRLSIYRPKTDFFQEIPVPKRLAPLAQDLMENAIAFSEPARTAFSHYLENFADFASINRLFIPSELQPFFEQRYFRRPPIKAPAADPAANEFELEADARPSLRDYVGASFYIALNTLRGVDEPEDYFPLGGKVGKYLSLKDVKELLDSVEVELPDELKNLADTRYIDLTYVCDTVEADEKQLLGIELGFYVAGRRLGWFSRVEDLRYKLLADFKNEEFPHWPFLSKDRKVRLDEALCVTFDNSIDQRTDQVQRKRVWWRPVPITRTRFISWIDNVSEKPPILFEALDIKLANGDYPAFTLHDARSYIQTQALIMGVGEPLLDVLAGRTPGPQSAHYDLRTPTEIVEGSIEGFDPGTDFKVVGPVAAAALEPEVVNRKIFLFQNATPKQITEVGGCSTSWSLNPCEQHGDCMRCGKLVWRKGDQKRLPAIRQMHQHSIQMINEGTRRLEAGAVAGPIQRHIRQHESVRSRCEQILNVESDASISVGTLVTFERAPELLGISELTSRLRDEEFGSVEQE